MKRTGILLLLIIYSATTWAQEPERELGEVVVAVKRDDGGEASARGLERRAVNVVNVLPESALLLAPDLSVGNTVQRMSGVTVERNSSGEGQYAILRGMDKRYNYTLVSGIKIPSPDNKTRAIPLDLFPPELLARLEVHKSLTADLEGDGIGGAVNLVMKDAPRERLLAANLATGYNALWMDNRFLSSATGSITRHSPDERMGNIGSNGVAASDFDMRSLRLTSRHPLPDLIGGLTYGDRFFRDRLGLLFGLTYQGLHRGKDMDYYNYTSSARPHEHRLYNTYRQRMAAHMKLDWRGINWYNGLIRMADDQVRTALAETEADLRLRHTRQTIYTSVLSGRHTAASDRLTLEWRAVGAKAWSETPDYAQVNFQGDHLQTNRAATRRWEHNTDRDLAAYADLSYHISSPWTVKAGAMVRDKRRTSLFHEYTFDSETAASSLQVYGTDWTNLDALRLTPRPYGNVGDPLNYDATERIGAVYAMGSMYEGGWEVTAGLRAEHTRQGYTLRFPRATDGKGRQRYWDLLPSLHLKRRLTATMKLHLSYTRATNRPTYFEIVPYSILGDDYKEKGNPGLRHAVADNVDLRWEWFPRDEEQVMVGFFYKHIQHPIEYGLINEGQDTYYTPLNTPTAQNGGVEVDVMKRFGPLAIKANYTYTLSRITTQGRVMEGSEVRSVSQTRPLYGQAPHVANLSLILRTRSYSAQVTTGYIGKRLVDVSNWAHNDVYENDYWRMELSAERRWRCGVELYAKASNLLNLPMVRYIERGPHTEGVACERYHGKVLERKERYGQTLIVGVRYRL